jgi:hypothetical protein
MPARRRAALLLALLAFHAAAGFAQVPAGAYRAGQAVEVEYGGAWYPAVVVSVEAAGWRIRYDGYGDEWDETVGAERIRLGAVAAPAPAGAAAVPADALSAIGAYLGDDGKIYYDPEAIGLTRDGVVVARIDGDRRAYVGDREVGRFDWGRAWFRAADGVEWEITARGQLKRAGKIVGAFNAADELVSGDAVVAFLGGGSIYRGDVLWGEAADCDGAAPDLTPVALLLAAAFPEFGFLGR